MRTKRNEEEEGTQVYTSVCFYFSFCIAGWYVNGGWDYVCWPGLKGSLPLVSTTIHQTSAEYIRARHRLGRSTAAQPLLSSPSLAADSNQLTNRYRYNELSSQCRPSTTHFLNFFVSPNDISFPVAHYVKTSNAWFLI